MPNYIRTLKEHEIAYIAGLVDGEGSINIHHKESTRQYWLSVTVVSTHRGVLVWMRDRVGGGKIMSRAYGRHKTQYSLRLNSRQAHGLLVQLLPFLIIKKDEARVAIEFQETMKYRGGGRLQPGELENRARLKERLEGLRA